MFNKAHPGPFSVHPNDSHFSGTVVSWLESMDDRNVGSDMENEQIDTDHDSNREQSTCDNEEFSETNYDKKMFYGKQRCYKWNAREFYNKNTVTLKHNIILKLPSLKLIAWALPLNPDPVEVWNLFLSPDILDEIVKWTNVKLESMRSKYNGRPRDIYMI